MAETQKESVADVSSAVFAVEVCILTGKTKLVRLFVDDNRVDIPVPEAVYAYWNEQFVRKAPTDKQRRMYSTVKNLMKYAYAQGYRDGRENG